MIQITNAELLTAAAALGILADKEIPVDGTLHVVKLMRAVTAEVRAIEQVKQKMLEKYGEHSDDGKLKVADNGQVKIVDLANWNADWTVLMNETAEFDIQIKRSDLGRIDLAPKVIFDLGQLYLEEDAK